MWRLTGNFAIVMAMGLAANTVPAQTELEVIEEFDEPPVTIESDRTEGVESMRLANGQIRYKVTPKSGKPYCFIMQEADPFDPFSVGANYRVPCD